MATRHENNTTEQGPQQDGGIERELRRLMLDMRDMSPGGLDTHSIFHRNQFMRFGRLDDVDKAIEYGTLALVSTPEGHPDLPVREGNLGVSYFERFQRLGILDDLEKAIEHGSRAVTFTPEDDPDPASHLGSLGSLYGIRFLRLGEIHDLDISIQRNSRALALTPEGHPDLALRHGNLGSSYGDRFRRMGEMQDLEKAVEHHSLALALAPDGHPDLPGRYFSRAYTYFSQYQHTTNPDRLASSLHFYRKASQHSTGAPRTVFQNALRWANRAVLHSSLNPIEAYQTAIGLLPHFIWLGATTSQRYQDISQIDSLAFYAAKAAILHFNPNLALEWPEHAQFVVWNQSLMLRTPLDQLQTSHP